MKLKLNTPLPQPLHKECLKAAQIFDSFVDSNNNGLDGVVPRHVLENALGFAIYSVFKAGFLLSARAGGGIVIARLDDGSWSAPSAIGTAGMGLGTQAGAELTDVLIVLNSRAAVRSFMSAGAVTLGTSLSVAVGPLGRNGEASGSISTGGKVSATYSYSKTRGLFGGVSVEGSVIVERQDANCLAYQSDVSAKQLLSGAIEPPSWAALLIKTIEARTGIPGGHKWIQDAESSNTSRSTYAFAGIPSPSSDSSKLRKRASSSPFSWGKRSDNEPHISRAEEGVSPLHEENLNSGHRRAATHSFGTQFDSDYSFDAPLGRREAPLIDLDSSEDGGYSNAVPSIKKADLSSQLPPNSNLLAAFDEDVGPPPIGSTSRHSRTSSLKYRSELSTPLQPGEGVGRAIALFDYEAKELGDLSFKKGEVIIITEKTERIDDWWTGKVGRRKGVFPANFVEQV